MSYMLDKTLFILVFHTLTNAPEKPQKQSFLFLMAPLVPLILEIKIYPIINKYVYLYIHVTAYPALLFIALCCNLLTVINHLRGNYGKYRKTHFQ